MASREGVAGSRSPPVVGLAENAKGDMVKPLVFGHLEVKREERRNYDGERK